MIVNCLNCGKSVSSRLNNCPYCKWETEEEARLDQKPLAVHGYKEAIKGSLRNISGVIVETVLRYAHK